MRTLVIPEAPNSIQKGVPLKEVLGKKVIEQLGENLNIVHESFPKNNFIKDALNGLEPLSITQRGTHIAEAMYANLPKKYEDAVDVILKSLTPPLEKTEGNGLATFFYMPHCNYVAKYGLDKAFNDNKDPFDISMNLQYELTKRFTAEFSIRSFIINDEKRTMDILYKWVNDENPHVRRLTSEGTRPRLPWAIKIPSFVEDPSPSLPILEELKNDPDLYVRRSVANHLGDIGKDNLDILLETCERWLNGASTELKWVIRHALRHPAKKENKKALQIRKAAK